MAGALSAPSGRRWQHLDVDVDPVRARRRHGLDDTYWGFDPVKLERMWQMKTKVLEAITKCGGWADYKLPRLD
eukprot:SAG22_NODE_350_length_11853_cov_3.693211_8_plen_73_part_00